MQKGNGVTGAVFKIGSNNRDGLRDDYAISYMPYIMETLENIEMNEVMNSQDKKGEPFMEDKGCCLFCKTFIQQFLRSDFQNT